MVLVKILKCCSCFVLVCSIALALFSCNKDEEITINVPDDPEGTLFTVIEYLPAPGQFINEKVSGFENVPTSADACVYAQKRFETNDYVSLGAWGGFISVKTPVSIVNTGGYEFSIGGNAFNSSNEAGIVWVMSDSNGNGLADDEWYELKGSYFGQAGYIRNYWVTYYKPEKARTDVRWEDSEGNTGYVKWMGQFHNQDFYYPEWVIADSYTLYGSRLPSLAIQNPETGIWSNPAYKWGYADNEGEDSIIVEEGNKKLQKNYFRISDAVDKFGNSINLHSIDFIKVQTAINGASGVIGENSTEICGFFIEQ